MINKFDLGSILVLELEQPPSNAFTLKFLKELYRELKLAEKDTHKIGIILKSKYKSCFSAGLDLGSMPKEKFARRCRIFFLVCMVHKLVRFITRSKKIYITSLKGAVIGSAVSLVLACDFCFADMDVWFWLPDPFYGGLLADGGIELIKKYTGISNAKRLCLANQRIEAREAKEMGIVSRIAENGSLNEEVLRFAYKLAEYSFTTLGETKRMLNQDICGTLPLLRLWKVILSKEMEERMNRILGKRKGGNNGSGK